MATTAHTPQASIDQAGNGGPQGEEWTTGQAGSGSFPELVRAHFRWERADGSDPEAAGQYRTCLDQFEAREGPIMHAYWSTKRPSAVALTVKPSHGLAAFLSDHDAEIRLHRVTDWVVRERLITDLLHHCDTLAIKVSEVLRGTSERIAMQWIYSVESDLLGFIERTRSSSISKDEINTVARSQSLEIVQIEKYYSRAADKAARIVYFWGMMIGVLVAALLMLAIAFPLWRTGWFDQPHTRAAETFFVSYMAGGVGAVVSVLMRMSSNTFRVDFEIGRLTVRRLGSFRPFIGCVFGIALFFLIKSGIPNVKLPADTTTAFFFLGSVAFLAGFNERWANVMFGKAERTVAVSLSDTPAQVSLDQDEEN
ncbi:MAG TPA: hypothetical protein VJW23_19960 [Propionibacteriaceae bacterium]|nr:hypothetical protein [Propionibacteriaceae bacterium]